MFRRRDGEKNRQVSKAEAAQEEIKFREHIRDETVKARIGLNALLVNSNITNLGCVDKTIDRSQAEIPGGGLLLFLEGRLEEWFANRRGLSGQFLVHLHCGYLFVEENLNLVGQHSSYIKSFKSEVKRLNGLYKCNFTVKVANDGSAKPFMGAK